MFAPAPRSWFVAVVLVALASGGDASAQSDGVRVAEEPTAGVDVGPSVISGEHDGLATVLNPAGLHFLEGSELDLAYTLGDDDEATAPGAGFGLFNAGSIGGGVMPRLGIGLGLEVIRPARARLLPDPGSPTRFTGAVSLPLGRLAALGIGWHHFYDSGPLGGLDTFDLGLAAHLGAHVGLGAVVRDVGGPTIAGVDVEPRYELEVTARPAGDDRLELALGGRIGHDRGDVTTGEDVDGWVRASLRVLRGAHLRAELESHSLRLIADDGEESERRELRLTAGLELSFGSLGAATYARSSFGDGDRRLASGTAVLRVSSRPEPPLLPPTRRLEKLDLGKSIGEREHTSIVLELRRLARDPALVGVVVEFDGLAAGWAQSDELRRELMTLRRAGKKVFAYMVGGTTRQYFVASAADRIYVDPAGGVRLQGTASQTLYFKGLFDRLGVLAQFEKIEEFKSAPEAYTMEGPSAPARRMREELTDSIYTELVTGIAKGRRVTRERARTLIDNGPYTAGDLALIPELVDAVVTPDELERELARELGRRYPVVDPPRERPARWSYPAIAVVYIDGDIVDGKSQVIPLLGTRLVGGETIAEAIKAAADSPSVKAIVLRINSPGGSAQASEIMAREVFAAREKKPVICSMGDVAASGGYFAAAGCHVVFADPMTITGSIGIFTGKFDFSGLLGKLGVTWFSVARGKSSAIDSPLNPWTPAERALIKRKLHYYYGRFIQTVARGRGLTAEQVDSVGRGHVWTGSQALGVKLVDRLGGLADAVALAKQRIGLPERGEVRLVSLPPPSGGLLSRLLGPAASAATPESSPATFIPPDLLRLLREAFPGSLWHSSDAVQARLSFGLILPD